MTQLSPCRPIGCGAWSAAAVAAIADGPFPTPPVIAPGDWPAVVPGQWLWDLWPVQDARGGIAQVAGGALWMGLSAPITITPVDRHGVARLWLLHHRDHVWHDLGPVLPDGHSPGSREWSGSAMLDGDQLVLHFTAAGRRGEASASMEQRLFMARARLRPGPRLADWTPPIETARSDGIIYNLAREASGAVGKIKAFRDPAWFRDPDDGVDYLLFTASLAGSSSAFNGAVGLARREGDDWRLLPPLVTADGVNNELERPHIIVANNRRYLFWSTQAAVFAPGLTAPTGLYGMVADAQGGDWAPINGTGLVFGNPPTAPQQAYSWLVLGDLRVTSFVDHRPAFVGQPAPELRLILDGDAASLA